VGANGHLSGGLQYSPQFFSPCQTTGMRPLHQAIHRTVTAAVARPGPLVSCADSLRIVSPAIIGALHRLIDDFGHDPISPLPAGVHLFFEPVIQESYSLMCRVGSTRLARPRLASALSLNRSTPPFHGTGRPYNFFSLAAVWTLGASFHCRAPTIKH